MFSYSGKILHVDLSKEKAWEEPLSQERIRNFLGGRGINAALLFETVAHGADPLGARNVLIFGTGALSGTFAPASGRTTVTCKGPATHLYLKSSVGGHFGPELKFAGFDQLIIYGKARKPVYLWIRNSRVEIRL